MIIVHNKIVAAGWTNSKISAIAYFKKMQTAINMQSRSWRSCVNAKALCCTLKKQTAWINIYISTQFIKWSVFVAPLFLACISFLSITRFWSVVEPTTMVPPPVRLTSFPPATFNFTSGVFVPMPTLPETYKPFAGGTFAFPIETPHYYSQSILQSRTHLPAKHLWYYRWN